jgi:hypothetical protein
MGGVQRHSRVRSWWNPQGHGFIAVASMNRAGKVRDMAARAMQTVPSSHGCLYCYPESDISPHRFGGLIMADNFIVDYDARWTCALLYWNARLGRSEFSLLDTTTAAGQMQWALFTVEPWSIAQWVWSADWHSESVH